MDRRALLTGAASVPVALAADRLRAAPDLSEEEWTLLRMCARDFEPDELHEYRTFDRDSAVVALARRMQEQGLLVFNEQQFMLPSGECVNRYYTASEYGRTLLRRA